LLFPPLTRPLKPNADTPSNHITRADERRQQLRNQLDRSALTPSPQPSAPHESADDGNGQQCAEQQQRAAVPASYDSWSSVEEEEEEGSAADNSTSRVQC